MARSSLSKLLSLVNDTCEEAPVEKQFVTDLRYSIEKDDEKNIRVPSKTFKPSSIGGCDRRIYYQLVGAERDVGQPKSASNIGILESGSDRHERLQKALCGMKDNGIDLEYVDVETFVKQRQLDYIEIKEKQGMETKCFWADIPLSFLTDGIIRYKGKYYILEIKTMNSRKFYESRDVREEHKDQGICYSAAFGLDNVIYLYENRETLDKKAFLFHVTDEMREDLLQKTRRIKACAEKEVPPEVMPTPQKCRYCEYAQMCQKDGR